MGLFDGFLDKMKLSEDYDDDENELYDDEEDEAPVSKRRSKSEDIFEDEREEERSKPAPVRPARAPKQSRPASRPPQSSQSKVVSMQRNSKALEVCVIKPTNVEDGREISDTLLSGRAVVLNLEGIDVDLAQRIIDFTSGACYSISGNLQKISNYIFVVTPENIDISGDFQELMSNDFKFNSGSVF